jgi:hypothetical protein
MDGKEEDREVDVLASINCCFLSRLGPPGVCLVFWLQGCLIDHFRWIGKYLDSGFGMDFETNALESWR